MSEPHIPEPHLGDHTAAEHIAALWRVVDVLILAVKTSRPGLIHEALEHERWREEGLAAGVRPWTPDDRVDDLVAQAFRRIASIAP